MSRRASSRDGYVLVLTLGLVALAAISLAGLARFSLGYASSTRDAAQDLQRRWGLYSTRLVLFVRAQEILNAQVVPGQENMPPWPKPSSGTASFNLGGERYSVTLADEDAKINVNSIYLRKRDRTAAAIRQATHASGASDLPIHLLPQTGTGKPFSSWGQVFDLRRGGSANERVGTQLQETTRAITCWGTGGLNLRTASDQSVRQIASLVLPTKKASELVELRKHWGGQTVEALLTQLDLRRPQLAQTTRLFSTESHHYSMWVEIDNGQRSSSYFFVDENTGPVCFAW
jgi:hypothetical protein